MEECEDCGHVYFTGEHSQCPNCHSLEFEDIPEDNDDDFQHQRSTNNGNN